MKTYIGAALAAAAFLAGGAAVLNHSGMTIAAAQEASASSKRIVEAAKARGEIGERIDGYLAAVGTLSPDVKAAMDDINISRKVAYEKLADSRGLSIRVVAQLAGENLIDKAGSGQYVMGEDGQWTQK
ncbi:YdbL family protein [uncultured Algimonas sp.]|uniref:YdbL family protein n=1 Tax=uncultured Algimonas sp. TaxID=1547920 RepID=UPI002627EBAC|nr:YdbL family protein [uncultured Algimonas sp.]